MAEWFNPHNPDHCRAYRYFQKTGAWPEGFELRDVELDGTLWQVNLMGKMTTAWVDHVLGDSLCPVLKNRSGISDEH